MASFFGNTTQTATDNPGGPIIIWTNAFVCPGSGNQNIQEISAYCFEGGSSSFLRLGVYSSDGATLIAEGTARISIAGGALAWQGHTTQATVKAAGGVSPGVLVGGTSYRIAMAIDGTLDNLGYAAGTNSHYNVSTDYTNGMPASLPAATDINFLYNMRCGVDPAVIIPDTPIRPATMVSIVP